MAHTPGPWKLVWHGTEQYPYQLSVNTENDASWIARDGVTSSEDNARLIAAAPDLLEALEDCLREHGGYTIRGGCEKRSLAAIAKATGETE